VEIAGSIVAIVATVLLVAGVAQRFRLIAPLALLVVGVLVSYVPFITEPQLSSEVVLVGLLPPILYAAALRTSLVDFRANISPIAALSVGLVIFTAFGVGLVAWWLLDVPFAVAFALGAVVAPPDAVAATAVARRIGLPRRIVTILEGESLVNDATALVSLRTAIAAFPLAAASAGEHAEEVTLATVGLDFGRAVVVGVGFGVLVAAVIVYLRRHITDALIDTSLSLIVPWLAYLPAEHYHGSGVLAVVVAGLLIGHKAPVVQTASSRLGERINWATIQFILENVVFLVLGLQMRRLVEDAQGSSHGWDRVILVCAAVLVTVIVLRPIYVFPFKWLQHRFLPTEGPFRPRAAAVISWAGMRGVVTLAAAYTLPRDTPQRPTLVLAAMTVTVGTLLLQGLTLPSLVRALDVRGPDPREDALQEATILQTSVAAGLKALEGVDDADPEIIDRLRERAETRTNIVWERLGQGRGDAAETPSEAYRRLRLVMLAAEREELLRIRDTSQVDQEVLAHVLAQLDVEESMLDRIEQRTDELREEPLLPPERAADECEHLAAHHDRFVPPRTPNGCQECLELGDTWVHLRLCLDCGHVGCCDSSPNKHASRHFDETGHPVMRSFEPGEAWRWCFVDQQLG
jgi:CPA1 family monovalent cation:H+ antiporter